MMERLEAERREAGTRALNAQEDERQRISRGLHDEVGQTMTGVLLQLTRLAQDATPEQRVAFSEAQAAVKASLEDVRRTAQELRPEVLDHLGLASALTNLARTFSDRTGITVERQIPAHLPNLDPNVELVLYRVAQESLTNAARHSGATEILLALEHDADSVVLRVLDNGRGFDGGTAEGGGLRGIRERALIIGGARRDRGGIRRRRRDPAAGSGGELAWRSPLSPGFWSPTTTRSSGQGLKLVLGAEPDLAGRRRGRRRRGSRSAGAPRRRRPRNPRYRHAAQDRPSGGPASSDDAGPSCGS